MNHQPVVSFLLSSLLGKKSFNQDRLSSLLPLSQSDLAGPVQSPWTYQHYFQAIQEVLAEDFLSVAFGGHQAAIGRPCTLLKFAADSRLY